MNTNNYCSGIHNQKAVSRTFPFGFRLELRPLFSLVTELEALIFDIRKVMYSLDKNPPPIKSIIINNPLAY